MFAFALPSSLQSFLKFALFTSTTSGKQKMTIHNIPNEVFVDILFPYFGLKDILRVRRVGLTP